MKTYQSFAKSIAVLLGEGKAVWLPVEGFMSLSIEEIGLDAGGHRLIAMSHTGEQNGDPMRDPEIVFVIHPSEIGVAAEPISFRNDYVGLFQEVYRYDATGKRTHVLPSLKRDLKNFTRTWFRNLREQGFFGPHVQRERLS